MPGTNSFYGQVGVSSNSSEHNSKIFSITQENGKNRIAIPVKILKVHGGGVGPAPTVDVQIMINQTDGVGQSTAHTTIYGIPAPRNQGGANVVINDPIVGDTGFLVVQDRDISLFKQSGGKQSNPGSFRVNDLADGVYQPGLCMQITPTQYLYFTGVGVTIQDKNGCSIVTDNGTMTLTASTINLVGNVHLGSTGGVPCAMEGTVDTCGCADVANLATKVWIT
jgi:hypothetical protein